jgi:hypothetical protein
MDYTDLPDGSQVTRISFLHELEWIALITRILLPNSQLEAEPTSRHRREPNTQFPIPNS